MYLYRSKEIELTGFNGTAAFMEVRVQSIVVEFILTHVPQLFPEQGETLNPQITTRDRLSATTSKERGNIARFHCREMWP